MTSYFSTSRTTLPNLPASAGSGLVTKPKRQYKRYSSEFKREALLRASEEGMTDKAIWSSPGLMDTFQFLKESVFHADLVRLSNFQRLLRLFGCPTMERDV